MAKHLPVMNGLETAQYIKSRGKGRCAIIIVVTAGSLNESRVKELSAGCDDFIGKPFREADIYDKIKKYLGMDSIYEKQEVKSARADVQTAEELQVGVIRLPLELRQRLANATVSADLEATEELIEEVRGYDDDLAIWLKAMTEDFNFRQISRLIQAVGYE